jgi:hypothetical protein
VCNEAHVVHIGSSSVIRGTQVYSSSRSIPRNPSTPHASLWDTEPLVYWRVKTLFGFGWDPTLNTIGWFRSCAAANRLLTKSTFSCSD